MSLSRQALERVYRQLLDVHGPQHWWPGDSPFEIMVGAVLTQNTAWSNVERAINNLRTAGLLDLQVMLETEPVVLAALIRPVGYYNIKAKRLLCLCRFLAENEALKQLGDRELRERLLRVHGIGPETADDILLYAFERPVFVIDAYTRRLFSRLGMVEKQTGYESLRGEFEQALGPQTVLFNEFHALIVRHAKEICRPRPRCDQCCLQAPCRQRL